jgi:hypothetical protein
MQAEDSTVDLLFTLSNFVIDVRLTITLDAVGQQRISISPYPFDRSSLDVGVVHRRLPTSQFENASAFQTAYFNATPRLAIFTFIDSDAS